MNYTYKKKQYKTESAMKAAQTRYRNKKIKGYHTALTEVKDNLTKMQDVQAKERYELMLQKFEAKINKYELLKKEVEEERKRIQKEKILLRKERLYNEKLGIAKSKYVEEKFTNKYGKLVHHDYTKALEGAFKEVIIDISEQNKRKHTEAYNEIRLKLNKYLIDQYKKNKDSKKEIRAYVVIKYTMKRYLKEDETSTSVEFRDQGGKRYELIDFFYHSKVRYLKGEESIKEQTNLILKEFDDELGNKGHSSIVIESIDFINIKTNYVKSMMAGSQIKIPDVIKNKKCCLNPDNKDNKCFDWCLIINHCIKNNILTTGKGETKRYKKHIDLIRVPENQNYPVKITDIKLYEELNNMKINVLELDKDNVAQCIYNNNEIRNENIVNLLYIEEGDNSHYLLIKRLGALRPSEKINNDTKHICPQCLSYAGVTKEKLDNHLKLCMKKEAQKVIMPEKDLKMRFKNNKNQFKHPFFVIADFESTLKKINIANGNTTKYQQHEANSYAVKYNCIHKNHDEEIYNYMDTNPEKVVESFVLKLEEYALKSYNLLQLNKSTKNIIFTKEQLINHKRANQCFNCKCEFTEQNKKCAHHDHISGGFISSLCNDCNLDFQYQNFIPVLMHNLKGYDLHLFIKGLAKYGYHEDKLNNITCIPNNEEKYISVSKNIKVGEYNKFNKEKDVMEVKPIYFTIKFVDTIAFMATSLDALVKNLESAGNGDINKLRSVFKYTSERYVKDNQFVEMIKKGVYPYDWMDDMDKMNKTKLPKQKYFYSKLTESECNKSDYAQANKVWDLFECKTFKDYHNLYLNTDVLLLSDVWNNFVNTCFNIYEIDPNYYLTAPSLSWDAFLKHKKDNQKYLFKQEIINCVSNYNKIKLEKKEKIIKLLNEVNIENTILNNVLELLLREVNDTKLRDYLNKFNFKNSKEFYIELLNDMDMFLFCEDAIRGGISQISTRYAEANNKYMGNLYNKDIQDSYIMYLDANNLYGGAMCSYLPLKDFKWNEDKWDTNAILNLEDKSNKGYLFEVKISLDEKHHDLFNQYPLLPERKSIMKKDLNGWQQEDYKESRVEKLVLTLETKDNYVVNYRYLKLALKLGYTLEKVYKVLEYTQDCFMESYIMKNTNQRKLAKNDFEKDFWKLMSNSCYGKTLENVRNRINFRLLDNEVSVNNMRNELKRFTIFSEDLVGVHLEKKQVTLNKPIFIGQNILDQSKITMAKFHYEFMIPKIGRENIDLLFTDTDSLCYHIKNRDIYEIIKNNKDEFDLSDYPKEHALHDTTNKKVVEKMKDESNGSIITHFVGLRSKMYAYKILDDSDKHMRCKGVKKYVVKKDLHFEDYKNTLFNRENKVIAQNCIRSHNHILYTETVQKVGLSYADDKVFILDNNVNCYNFGHKRISIIQNFNELPF